MTQAGLAPLAESLPRWSSELECGDALIDEQHRALFTQVGRMKTALEAGDPAAVVEYLDELVTQTIEHFRCEEEVLRQCGYGGLREHQLGHLSLLERTLTYRYGVTRGTTPLAELLRFLVDEVITKHLIETDRQYYDSLSRRAHRR